LIFDFQCGEEPQVYPVRQTNACFLRQKSQERLNIYFCSMKDFCRPALGLVGNLTLSWGLLPLVVLLLIFGTLAPSPCMADRLVGVVTDTPLRLAGKEALAGSGSQSLLALGGSLSVRISKGRLLFKVGEITNSGTHGVASGRLELSLWLSKTPYDGIEPIRGTRIGKCNLDGVVGGETAANISCQARLRLFSRGTYFLVAILSELDASSGSFIERDFFRFSRRVKL
jgi:hypothetical protein